MTGPAHLGTEATSPSYLGSQRPTWLAVAAPASRQGPGPWSLALVSQGLLSWSCLDLVPRTPSNTSLRSPQWSPASARRVAPCPGTGPERIPVTCPRLRPTAARQTPAGQRVCCLGRACVQARLDPHLPPSTVASSRYRVATGMVSHVTTRPPWGEVAPALCPGSL